jgi:hypothetical protein
MRQNINDVEVHYNQNNPVGPSWGGSWPHLAALMPTEGESAISVRSMPSPARPIRDRTQISPLRELVLRLT